MKKFINVIFVTALLFVFTGISFADNYFVPNIPGKKLSSEGSTSSFKFEKHAYDNDYDPYLYIKNKNTSKVFGKKSMKLFFSIVDVKNLFYTLIAIRNKELYFVADGVNPKDVRRMSVESLQEMGYVNQFNFTDENVTMYVMPIIKNGVPIIIFYFRADDTNISEELWIVDEKKLDSIIKDLGRIRDQIYKKYKFR